MTRPPATISVDVDRVDHHLLGYGHRGLPPDPCVYTRALPRLTEAFARAGVRATFFIVGGDAPDHAAALASLIASGHEVASHSHRHPLGLTRLSPPDLAFELGESRRALESACGAPVIGFRAPNFDMDARLLGELEKAGYRYDASAYPTPFLIPARLLLALKSDDALGLMALRTWPFTWRRGPHRLGGEFAEFPTSVTRVLRFPIYHTMRFFSRPQDFVRRIEQLARRGEALSYPLHAVDALGLVEDGVDPRLGAHPGMKLALDAKLALLDETLALIRRLFETSTFRERLARGELA